MAQATFSPLTARVAPQYDWSDLLKHWNGREIQLWDSSDPAAGAFRLGPKMDGQSTYAGDFPRYAVAPPGALPKSEYKPSPYKLDGTTTYSQNFPGHKPQPHLAAAPPQVPPSVPFTATTGYREEFKAWDVPPPFAAPKAEFKPSPYKLDGTTTYKQNFPGYQPEPHMAAKVEFKPSSVPFDAISTYGTDFPRHAVQPPAPPPKTEYKPSPYKLDGTTTTGSFFKEWVIPKKRSSIGLQTVNGRFYILVRPEDSLPFQSSKIFTSVHDNQAEVSFIVLQGDSPTAHQNKVLGYFDLVGIPPAEGGTPRIEVTFTLDEKFHLTVSARDLDTGRQELWEQTGGALLGSQVSFREAEGGQPDSAVAPAPAQ